MNVEMLFLGIDCGLTGGIAALDDEGNILLLEAMPVMPGPVAKRNVVSPTGFAAYVRGLQQRGRVNAAVERVGSMPRQSGVSMFSFGQSVGTVIGVLGALGVGYELVLPQKWQKHHSLSADKSQTLGWAMRRWPHLELRKKDDGLADALAIADWLRQLFRL